MTQLGVTRSRRGEAVPDRMAWRWMVGSAINDTVGGYQK